VRSSSNSHNLLLSPPSTIFISSPVFPALIVPSLPSISQNSTSPVHDLHPFTPISTSSHSATPLASPNPSTPIHQFSSSYDSEHPAQQDISPSLPLPPSHMVTRSQSGHLKPRSFPSFHIYYSTRHPLQALHAGMVISKPCTYAQAASLPEWHATMDTEF